MQSKKNFMQSKTNFPHPQGSKNAHAENSTNLEDLVLMGKLGSVIPYSTPSQPKAKYVLSVDWFEVTIKGYLWDWRKPDITAPEAIEFDDGNIELRQTKIQGNKVYQQTYEIYVGEEKEPFGIVFTRPKKSSFVDKDCSQIQVYNHQLYRPEWNFKVKYVLEAVGATINNFSRLDIAVDGNGFYSYLKMAYNGFFTQVGNTSFSATKKGKDFEYFTFGKGGSKKFMRIYNKSKELETTNKQYIRETWTRNNLDTSGRVERLELRMRNDSIKLLETTDPETGEIIKGINLDQLDNQQYLAGILKAQFKGWFEFREGRDKKINRKKEVEIIDWDAIQPGTAERISSTRKPNETWRAKQTLKGLAKQITRMETEPENRTMKAMQKGIEKTFPYKVRSEAITDGLRQMAYEFAKEHDLLPYWKKLLEGSALKPIQRKELSQEMGSEEQKESL